MHAAGIAALRTQACSRWPACGRLAWRVAGCIFHDDKRETELELRAKMMMHHHPPSCVMHTHRTAMTRPRTPLHQHTPKLTWPVMAPRQPCRRACAPPCRRPAVGGHTRTRAVGGEVKGSERNAAAHADAAVCVTQGSSKPRWERLRLRSQQSVPCWLAAKMLGGQGGAGQSPLLSCRGHASKPAFPRACLPAVPTW